MPSTAKNIEERMRRIAKILDFKYDKFSDTYATPFGDFHFYVNGGIVGIQIFMSLTPYRGDESKTNANKPVECIREIANKSSKFKEFSAERGVTYTINGGTFFVSKAFSGEKENKMKETVDAYMRRLLACGLEYRASQRELSSV